MDTLVSCPCSWNTLPPSIFRCWTAALPYTSQPRQRALAGSSRCCSRAAQTRTQAVASKGRPRSTSLSSSTPSKSPGCSSGPAQMFGASSSRVVGGRRYSSPFALATSGRSDCLPVPMELAVVFPTAMFMATPRRRRSRPRSPRTVSASAAWNTRANSPSSRWPESPPTAQCVWTGRWKRTHCFGAYRHEPRGPSGVMVGSG
mmetsp:Transcript_63264/g.176020  ORF Transcript_63264/g.176020 Transcript_63264/m.176020 type:complete len:202 (-) Transcript_63264:27-632(-)